MTTTSLLFVCLDGLGDDPIPEVSLRDLGEHQLKDMDEPERIYQLVAPGLREDFLALKTAAPPPFEGREGELAEAATVFRSEKVLPGAIGAPVTNVCASSKKSLGSVRAGR